MNNLIQELFKNRNSPNISVKLYHKGIFKQDDPFLDFHVRAGINPNDFDKIQQQLKGENQ